MKTVNLTLAAALLLVGSQASAQVSGYGERTARQYQARHYESFRYDEPVTVRTPTLLVPSSKPVTMLDQVTPSPLPDAVGLQHHHSSIGCNDCSSCGLQLAQCRCRSCYSFFFDYLYLTARGVDIGYAFDSDPTPVQPTGPTHQLDYDYDDGYRYGASMCVDQWLGICNNPCAAPSTFLSFTGTHFSTDTSDIAVAPTGPDPLQPLLLVQPVDILDATQVDVAFAKGELDFDTYDLDYSHRLFTCRNWQIDGICGIRIGTLDQRLNVIYDLEPTAPGNCWFDSDIDLRGAGFRFGLGSQKCFGPLVFNTRSTLSLLASDIDVNYIERSPDGDVDYYQDMDRIVPVLDLEFSVGYDVCDNVRLSLGYMYSIWFNVITHSDLIDSLRTYDYGGEVSDDISFDGFFARFQYNW